MPGYRGFSDTWSSKFEVLLAVRRLGFAHTAKARSYKMGPICDQNITTVGTVQAIDCTRLPCCTEAVETGHDSRGIVWYGWYDTWNPFKGLRAKSPFNMIGA
jgi:hypothetical protein